MENRTMVYESAQEHSANLMRDKLEAAGINVLILDGHDSISEVVGTYSLYVENTDAEKAKAVVAQNR